MLQHATCAAPPTILAVSFATWRRRFCSARAVRSPCRCGSVCCSCCPKATSSSTCARAAPRPAAPRSSAHRRRTSVADAVRDRLAACRVRRRSSARSARGEALVGVSHECDHPAFVRGLPAVTRPKLDVHRASVAIDADVRSSRRRRARRLRDRRRRASRRCVPTSSSRSTSARSVRSRTPRSRRRRGRRSGRACAIVSLAPRTLADVWDDVDAGRGRRSIGVAGDAVLRGDSRQRLASLARSDRDARSADGRLRRVARPADVGGALDVGARRDRGRTAIRSPTSARGATSRLVGARRACSPTSSC